MDRIPDVLELAQALIREDTTNPPGNEEVCSSVLRSLLEAGGFRVQSYTHAPSRTSFIARAGVEYPRRSLCFVGHLDTVPLGKGSWTHPPFAAEIHDGRLYGRGACDMKSGVAAFVCAALQRVKEIPDDCGLVLILTAGEETGCEGSRFMAELGTRIDGLEGVIVCEPTGNMPLVGHKGALWLRATFAGVAAHGSMPSAGDNAIFKGVDAVLRLRHFCAGRAAHPVLGAPTLNIGIFHAGENVNSVPDHAELGLDLRTTPGLDHGELRREIADSIGAEHKLEVTTSMAPVYTSTKAPWVKRVFALIAGESGRIPDERAAPFFTDASALGPVTQGAPTLILGPGEPAQMHKVDEYCDVEQIHEAVRLYRAIIDDAFAASRNFQLTEIQS